jgi:hypothetical protein
MNNVIYDPIKNRSELRKQVETELDKARKKGLKITTFLEMFGSKELKSISENKLEEINKLLNSIT